MLLLIAIAVVAFVLVPKFLDDDSGPLPLLNAELTYDDPTGETDYEELAKRFRPFLLFDASERWRPLAVEPFFDEGIHTLCASPGDCEPAGSYSRFRDLIGGRFANARLLVNGKEKREPAREFMAPGSRCEIASGDVVLECPDSPSAIYYHVRRAGTLLLFDYWWYFRFNDSDLGDHQADWEGVVVAVDEDHQRTFEWAGFAAHKGVWMYPRASLSCDRAKRAGTCEPVSPRSGRHVNVYVASGSHASYPFPCNRDLGKLALCLQNESIPVPGLNTRFLLPETGFDGTRPWTQNRAAGSLQAMEAQSWLSWPGRWGGEAAVQSPGVQARFRTPALARAGDCPPGSCKSAVPGYGGPCGRWFGPQAAVTVCNRHQLRSTAGAPGFSLTPTTGAPPAPSVGAEDSVGASPGVAQLPGAFLEPGDAVSITGEAPPETKLFARARAGAELVEARFREIGLESSAPARLSVRERAGSPLLRLRTSGGRRLKPRVHQFK